MSLFHGPFPPPCPTSCTMCYVNNLLVHFFLPLFYKGALVPSPVGTLVRTPRCRPFFRICYLKRLSSRSSYLSIGKTIRTLCPSLMSDCCLVDAVKLQVFLPLLLFSWLLPLRLRDKCHHSSSPRHSLDRSAFIHSLFPFLFLLELIFLCLG